LTTAPVPRYDAASGLPEQMLVGISESITHSKDVIETLSG
jgi:hypothetical protein